MAAGGAAQQTDDRIAKRIIAGAILHHWPPSTSASRDNGFIIGRDVTIDYHWAHGRFDRLPAMAAELVRRQVALIVTLGPPAGLAAKAATTTIPIVFHNGGDVVKMGLVASLARPGGNATGVNLFTQAVEAKKLDLLSKLVSTATTFAFLLNPNNPAAEEKANEMRDAARALDRQLDVVGAGTEGRNRHGFCDFHRPSDRGAGHNGRSVLR